MPILLPEIFQYNFMLAFIVFFAWLKLFKYISFNTTMNQVISRFLLSIMIFFPNSYLKHSHVRQKILEVSSLCLPLYSLHTHSSVSSFSDHKLKISGRNRRHKSVAAVELELQAEMVATQGSYM